MESEAPVSGMQANGGSSVECDTSVPSSGGIDLRSIINPCKLPTCLRVCIPAALVSIVLPHTPDDGYLYYWIDHLEYKQYIVYCTVYP